MKKNIIIFDKQDITRLGVEALIKQSLRNQPYEINFADTKNKLINALTSGPDSLVIIDYTLSDLNSADGLINISARFPEVHWILFSEKLSIQFLKRVVLCNQVFSVVLKTADLAEIDTAISYACDKKLFLCSQINDLLSISNNDPVENNELLTITEKEILKEIAWGNTAKEIAVKRNISVLTVVTHRKNIYRKLDVNNAQEASRYALRAGIVDASDYYI
ncbi:MAG: response regulator transcription factor [Dysgonamonadaceae bacterium]|jgi:DNA-binding NarL/FixJ family response regulator|nr:response regulator transcription factor [Dysgonamonadaceae bacterium]